MTFAEKLRICRRSFNLTQDALSEKLNTSKQVISRYETGLRIPKLTVAQQYADVLDLPVSVLIDPNIELTIWEHPSLLEDYWSADDNLKLHIVQKYGIDPRIAKDYSNIYGSPLGNRDNILCKLPENNSYPLLGDIACGSPILAEENISEYVQFPGDIKVDFCLRCRGDSMVDARIFDGDIVFIRQQPEVENGEIAAVLIGEETTLKRVYHSGDTLTLVAANSSYAPMVYTGQQLSSVRILGKAVSFLSNVK